MIYDKLVYTNSAGKSVEFSLTSVFHTNLRTEVTGLDGARTTLYRTPVVNEDGEVEEGYHLEVRDISISGTINERNHKEQQVYIRDLQEAFSPFLNGVLRSERDVVREIDVRPESAPNIVYKDGARRPQFMIDLVALNPNWRETAEREEEISSSGTSIYYDGSKACGLEIKIEALADGIDIESLTITNGDNVETVTFRTGGSIYLDTGDVLLLNTVTNGVDITLNGVAAFERIDYANTVFPRLYQGMNNVAWSAYGDEADFTVSVKYTPTYIGL